MIKLLSCPIIATPHPGLSGGVTKLGVKSWLWSTHFQESGNC